MSQSDFAEHRAAIAPALAAAAMPKIEAGQKWRTRGGRELRVLSGDNHETYPWNLSNGGNCTDKGTCWSDGESDEDDLIELLEHADGFKPWVGGEQPAETRNEDVLVKLRENCTRECRSEAGNLRWNHSGGPGDIVAYKVVEAAKDPLEGATINSAMIADAAITTETVVERDRRLAKAAAIGIDPGAEGGDHYAIAFAYMAAGTKVPSSVVNAITILEAAAGHMRDRAATYDKPEGERSMAQTVAAFNAITGRELSESEGWLLMDLLKLTRLFARPGFHQDSAEDHVAYGALLAEARAREAAESLPKD